MIVMPISKHTRGVFCRRRVGGLGGVGRAGVPARAGEDDSPARPSGRRPAAFVGKIAKMGIARVRHVHPLWHEHLRQQECPDGKAPCRRTTRTDSTSINGCRRPRRRDEVHRAHGEARRGPLPLAEQIHELHGGQQRDKTNVFEQLCKSCQKRGVLPGFYYCSWDNHHRFGSKTPCDGGTWEEMNDVPKSERTWGVHHLAVSVFSDRAGHRVADPIRPDRGNVDRHPRRARHGYRTYLYEHMAALQPETVVMMNSGIDDGAVYKLSYAWPSDLIAMERNVPPASGHKKWRRIEGKAYYMPGEVCDPMGKDWYWVKGDHPRRTPRWRQFEACRSRGANLLLASRRTCTA